MILTRSVGENGANHVQDVKYVQRLLNDWLGRLGEPGIAIDGLIGDETIGAINHFQRSALGFSFPDGLVEPGLNTIQALQEMHIAAVVNGLLPEALPHAGMMVAYLSQLEAETSEEAAQLREELENLQPALERVVQEYLQALHDA